MQFYPATTLNGVNAEDMRIKFETKLAQDSPAVFSLSKNRNSITTMKENAMIYVYEHEQPADETETETEADDGAMSLGESMTNKSTGGEAMMA